MARHLGVPVLTEDELGLTGPAPLWYYLLKEAEVPTAERTWARSVG